MESQDQVLNSQGQGWGQGHDATRTRT